MFVIFPSVVLGFQSIGCFDLPTNYTLIATIPSPISVLSCTNACGNRNNSFAAIHTGQCLCIQQDNVPRVRQNDAECNDFCSDGFICGGSNGMRVTIYSIDIPSGVPQLPTTANTEPVSSTSTVKQNIGKGNEIDQWKIAMIVVGVLAFTFLVAVGFFVYRKRQKASRRTSLPRLPTKSTEMIFPNLPKTHDMIYIVHNTYNANKPDEMTILVNQVVAIRSVFSDGWALATNITIGGTGVVPLACFVNSQDPIDIPTRNESSNLE